MKLDTEVHQGLGRSQARLPGIDRQTETLEQTQKVGSVLQEPPTGGVQEKEVVQVRGGTEHNLRAGHQNRTIGKKLSQNRTRTRTEHQNILK